MAQYLFYKVAGHTFRLSFPDTTKYEYSLSNYAPFRISDGEKNTIFHLSITEVLSGKEYKQVGQFDDDIASIGVYKSVEGNFRFRIAYPGSNDCCTMDADASFAVAQAVLPANEQLRGFCLNNCLMLLYAFATSSLDTVLMHASVIKHNNKGFMFLGKSGTGKSTHSRLWLEHIAGSELLNDDNPVIRVINGQAYVFGTPWSGKTPCYKNDNAPLKGIVKLSQAPENKIKKLSTLHGYAAVLPACSGMRWEEAIASGIHRTVEKLASSVACYHLGCLPNEAAAKLSSDTMQ
jgi:ABC-type nitrate/sulfonate/bicarbonate transport system, ATPase component